MRWAAILLIGLAFAAPAALAQEDVEALKARVVELEAKVAQLHTEADQAQKAIRDLRQKNGQFVLEIARLKQVCQDAGVDPNAPRPEQPESPAQAADLGDLVYQGHSIAAVKFEALYREFAGQIVHWQNTYLDAGRELLGREGIWTTPPQPGSVRWVLGSSWFPSTSVLSIVPDGAIVKITIPGMDVSSVDIFIHLEGLGPAFVDGSPITTQVPVIYTGPYVYGSADGARRTIQSYKPLQPLSREEFAEALRGGIVLVRYSEVVRQVIDETPLVSRRGQLISDKPRFVEKREIIGTPIR